MFRKNNVRRNRAIPYYIKLRGDDFRIVQPENGHIQPLIVRTLNNSSYPDTLLEACIVYEPIYDNIDIDHNDTVFWNVRQVDIMDICEVSSSTVVGVTTPGGGGGDEDGDGGGGGGGGGGTGDYSICYNGSTGSSGSGGGFGDGGIGLDNDAFDDGGGGGGNPGGGGGNPVGGVKHS
jgi:hypothetical protein